jgi:LacI family transcriptional regulator
VVQGRGISAINIDNQGGAGAMVAHLASLGRRRIGFIAGPERNHDAAERLAGYQAALAEAGLSAPIAALPGDFMEAGGYEAVRRLLELGEAGKVDALFAANDSMAVGALSALRRAGIRVPDDVAVGGFDDIPIAAYLSPALTTVQVPIAELGTHALEALLGAVQAPGAHEARQEVLPTRLVVRRSCGAPATAAADLGS